MTAIVDLLTAMDGAYQKESEGACGLAGFFDAATGREADGAAGRGDTLALFVVREVNDHREDDRVDAREVREALLRASADLFAMAVAIEGLDTDADLQRGTSRS